MSSKSQRSMKYMLSATVVLVAFAVVSPAFAQGGGVDTCKNSPENPTALLALVGSAGAGFVALRTKFRRK